jgi:hypothetical protein
VDAGSDATATRINDLEAEVNKANDDAAALDATVTAAGETPDTNVTITNGPANGISS